MKSRKNTDLLTRSRIGTLPPGNDTPQKDYLEVIRSLSRLTYESIYVINYEQMSFEYVSDNPLFLCGYTPAEVMELGYEFYFRHVPEEDLAMLTLINDRGFDFFEKLPAEDKMEYSITYDFHLVGRDGTSTLINHKLTPLFLTADQRMWKSLCVVSIAHHKTAGNIYIQKQGSDERWELDTHDKIWRRSERPSLTRREVEVLRLHARGLTISQIAAHLCVTPDTVKYYRRRIFERLDAGSIVEALSYAVSCRII